jgi:hypothetical protein
MEQARIEVPNDAGNANPLDEERAVPRFTLLIRAAKLVAPAGEFICVIRDVSSAGVSLRSFHPLPSEGPQTLELQTGERHAIERIWERGGEAGYRFCNPVEVHNLIAEAGRFPKRQLRLALRIEATIACRGVLHRATIVNLSQQGARVECASLFALEQPLRITTGVLPDVTARVRWRRQEEYGLVFDDTFSLRQLALFAATMQAPELLAEPVAGASLRNG